MSRAQLTGVEGATQKNSAEKDDCRPDMSSIRVQRDCACALTLFTKMEEGVPLRAPPNQLTPYEPYGAI